MARHNIELLVYDRIGQLPHFNPDLDKEPTDVAVADFRSHLHKSSGVIISSPEYAHGIPGVLKNAPDWLVRSGELYEKPVALFSASPRATYAQSSLIETLTVMTAKVVHEASITVSLLGRDLDESKIVSDPDLSREIRFAVMALARAIGLHGAGVD